jgi:hypothetical protein
MTLSDENKILILPRYLTAMRFVDVPSLKESDISRMAVFHALKEVPYSKEEIVVGYRNLGSYKDGFSSIMLIIAVKEAVKELMKGKGVVQNIRSRTELLYVFLLKKAVIDQNKVNLVAHIGKEDSELMVIDKTRIVFSRGFKNARKLSDEMDNSLLAYQRNKIHSPIDNAAAVYTPNADKEEAVSSMEKCFKLPVRSYEYNEDLALIDLSVNANLLPEEIRSENIKSRKRREILITYFLAGLAAVLFFTSVSFEIHEKNKILNLASSRLEKVRSAADSLEALLKKNEINANHIREGRAITEILKHSYELISPGTALSELSYDGEENVFYKGISDDMSFIFAFVKKLEESGYFDTVEIKYAAKRQIKEKELTDFGILCHIGAKQKL